MPWRKIKQEMELDVLGKVRELVSESMVTAKTIFGRSPKVGLGSKPCGDPEEENPGQGNRNCEIPEMGT